MIQAHSDTVDMVVRAPFSHRQPHEVMEIAQPYEKIDIA